MRFRITNYQFLSRKPSASRSQDRWLPNFPPSRKILPLPLPPLLLTLGRTFRRAAADPYGYSETAAFGYLRKRLIFEQRVREDLWLSATPAVVNGGRRSQAAKSQDGFWFPDLIYAAVQFCLRRSPRLSITAHSGPRGSDSCGCVPDE